MISPPPSNFLANEASIIGAVLRKNAALYVCINLCITIEAINSSHTRNIRLITQVQTSCGYLFTDTSGTMLSGRQKNTVKMRKAMSSGKVSPILPAYPKRMRIASKNTQIEVVTKTTMGIGSVVLKITVLLTAAPRISTVKITSYVEWNHSSFWKISDEFIGMSKSLSYVLGM